MAEVGIGKAVAIMALTIAISLTWRASKASMRIKYKSRSPV